MDLEAYRSKYYNLSMEELQKIRATISNTDSVFEFAARSLHEDRERVKLWGKPALLPQPLLQVLSVNVHLNGNNENKPFVVYGQIHVEYLDSGNLISHKLYNRDRSEAETLSSNGSHLTLIGPNDVSTRSEFACIPLFRSRVRVMLYDGDDNVFAQQCFSLDDELDSDDCYDCVKTKSIDSKLGSLSFKYIAIPFGINCRVEVSISNNRKASRKLDFADVNGKVVVRYGNNNYGSNYSCEEECVLLEIPENEWKRVEFDKGKMLQLSRCWVTVPAYSSLTIGLNLSDFGTKRDLVNDSVEFIPQQGWMSLSSFVSDDIIIQAQVAWFWPKPMGRFKANRDYHFSPSEPSRGISAIEEEKDGAEQEIMDTESSDDESDDASNLNPPWTLHPHRDMPLSSPAIEIFSVLIGRENTRAIQISGSIDVLSNDREICNIFKRNENEALILAQDVKSLPIPDGSRVFEDFKPLEMKCDIKDFEGRVAIKGYVDWAASILDSSSWHDKQICSFIRDPNGFSAIHYSIFSEAFGAYVRVFLNFKSHDADNVVVYGSIIAEYTGYDYSSCYKRNYFRNILVRKTKTQNDPIQLGIDSSIPLSRSMVVVPTHSSLAVDVDLDFEVSNQKFSCAQKIEIGIGEVCKTIDTSECSVRIELDWCEVK